MQNKENIYTPKEIKKIAPGYRGKPENFDPTKVGKGRSAKQQKSLSDVPNPDALNKGKTSAPTPLWPESIFGVNVHCRELSVNQEFSPTFARLPEITEEVYNAISCDDKTLSNTLTKGMLCYYSTAMLWTRLLDIKLKRGNSTLTRVEHDFHCLMTQSELNVPQPIYLFLKAIGHVIDFTGKYYLIDHDLPVVSAGGKTGYHAQRLDGATHNLFEEIPSLGVCGDVLMTESSPNGGSPTFGFLPAGTKATRNLTGYFGQVGPLKEDIRINLNNLNIDTNSFHENITSTRLNIDLVQRVSDYFARSPTFRNEKVKLNNLTSEGDEAQLIRTIPMTENSDVNVRWTNKIVRPISAIAYVTASFGASFYTGYQLFKEGTPQTQDAMSHANWSCVEKSDPASVWVLPEEWIKNRNERRALPVGMDLNRFVSISDSQSVRTKAITRRIIAMR